MRGKSFFSQKPNRKNSNNIPNSNNGNQQQQQQQRHTYYGQTGSQQQRYGRYNYSTADLLQHGFKSRKTNSVGIKKGLPIDKKIILVKKSGIDVPLAERLKHFRSLDENNTGSQNFGHSKRKQNSISFKTFSVKNLFPTNSKSRRGRIGETGSKRNVEKGAIRKVQRSKGEFVSNLFLVKKKDGGQRPVINLKQPNAYILYCHLHVQHRLCILFSSLGKKFKAICSLPLVRKLVRVPLSLLCLWDQHHEYSQNC